jgi:hypothetical protein
MKVEERIGKNRKDFSEGREVDITERWYNFMPIR